MSDLQTLLRSRRWRELYAIARAHGLPFNSHRTRDQIARRLYSQLTDGGALQQALPGLAAGEQAALAAIQSAGGVMQQPPLTRGFGAIRPYRPWADGEPKQPWKQPVSPVESLWYQAFIGIERPGDGEPARVYIPAEVLAMLPPPPSPTAAGPVPASRLSPLTVTSLLVDVALLLGSLLRDDVRLRYGRWLPVQMLRRLNAWLRAPEQLAGVRGELQAGRLRFLHYLVDVAGLAAPQGEWLKPTPAGWRWLAETPSQQWGWLWRAWRQDVEGQQDKWSAFRLPEVEPETWTAVLERLQELKPGVHYTTESLVDVVRLDRVGNADPADQMGALLRGPLAWSGLVYTSGDRLAVPADGAAALQGQFDGAFAKPAGALVTREDSGIQVILPAMPHLRPLVELLAWADADRHSLTFDAASMRRAVSQGSSAQRVAHVLAELSGGPLPLDLVETLEQWEREADQLRLQHVLVLSSPDAGLLRELRRKRTLRRSFDGAISPHHLAVKPHQREQLHRKLRRHGYAVRDELPAQQPASASTSALDETTAAYLWLAVRVYRDLSAVVKQSVPVPASVLDGLANNLPGREVDDLARVAASLIDDLKAELEGRAASPAPAAEEPEEAIWEAVTRAYEVSGALTIDYYSPARGTVDRRTIEPVMLSERGAARYVEAWCHLVGDTRTFRLDRIVRIVREPAE